MLLPLVLLFIAVPIVEIYVIIQVGEAIGAGRVPGREVVDGVLVIFGGALLLTPGFVTDIFGLAFLLPPTRAVIRRLLVRRFAGRIRVSGPPPRGGRGFDVDGTASEVDPQALP